MARKEDELLWQEIRRNAGLPEPKKVRERNKCFCCGEHVIASDGIWHSRLFEERGKAYVIELCCSCLGYEHRHER